MVVENYILNLTDSFNFIRTIFLVVLIIYIIECFKNKHKNSKLYLIVFILWQIVTSWFLLYLGSNTNVNERLLDISAAILFSILNLEGGILFVILGVLMYIFNDSKKGVLISFLSIVFAFFVLFNTSFLPRAYRLLNLDADSTATFNFIFSILFDAHSMFANSNLFYENAQWMMIFSLIFCFLPKIGHDRI